MSRYVIQRSRVQLSRREVLQRIFWTAGAGASASLLASCESSGAPGSTVMMAPESQPGGSIAPAPAPVSNPPTPTDPTPVTPPTVMKSRFEDIGPLQAADANGLMLPQGFTSRVVAVSGMPAVTGGSYVWHTFPDGGACYSTSDGGWVYTSNSEVPAVGVGTTGLGGCGALKFNKDGVLTGSYGILSNTRGNCAGGKTPWATWFSCEEVADGLTYECNPFAAGNGTARPALGLFAHEACVVDPVNKILYETEDTGDGRFYRFVPTAADWPAGALRPALAEGKLQVMKFRNGARGQTLDTAMLAVDGVHAVEWEDVAMPTMAQSTVRSSLGAANAPGSAFRGGEGLWHLNGIIYFSTKTDNRIWAYDHARQTVEVIYDFATASTENKILSGVDNLTVSEFGDVIVAEDGGDMDICVILPNRKLLRLAKASDTSGQSEVVGPAFSPDGTRLYFSCQRNGRNGAPGNGITFEITLPFSACPSGPCVPVAAAG